MKFDKIYNLSHNITEQQDKKVAGRKPRASAYSSNLYLDPELAKSFELDHYKDIAKFFQKSPLYLLNGVTDTAGKKVEPISLMSKIVSALSNEFSTSSNIVDTSWFFDPNNSPIHDAVRFAIEDTSGNPVTSKTKLKHTSRVVRNAIIETGIMADVEESIDTPIQTKSYDPNAIYEVKESLASVRSDLKTFLKLKLNTTSDDIIDNIIRELRFTIIKGLEVSADEINSEIVSIFKNIPRQYAIPPSELFNFLVSNGVLALLEDESDEDEDKELDPEKDEIPLLDLDDDRGEDISSDMVSRLTGGFGPQYNPGEY